MDPFTHTLVGAALADAGLRRTTALATPTLILGANLPDIDAVTYFLGSDLSLWTRRGWTHGVLAMVVLPLALAGAMLLFDRWSKHLSARAEVVRPGPLLALATLGVWSHPALDWLNTYGVRFLMPFDGTWFYGDTLYIIDPWLWLLLGGSVFLRRSGSTRSLVAWGTLATLTSLVVVSGASSPAVRVAWVSGLAILALWRWRGALATPSAPRWALAAAALYVALLMTGSRIAETEIDRALATADIGPVEDLLIGPVPASPHRRDVVVVTASDYRWGTYGWFRTPRLQLSDRSLERPRLDDPVVETVLSAPCLRGMSNWVRYPFLDLARAEEGFEGMLLDARYTRQPTAGFGGAQFRVDGAGAVRCEPVPKTEGDRR